MVIKRCAQIYGRHGSAQMDGLQAIPDPLDLSAFNGGGGGGGGVRNEAVFSAGPVPCVIHPLHQTSSAPNHLLLTTLPTYYHTAPAS
jgi:hypothetical protein